MFFSGGWDLPVVAFDQDSRGVMQFLAESGYVNSLLAGNDYHVQPRGPAKPLACFYRPVV
jgi:hypothetical protein